MTTRVLYSYRNLGPVLTRLQITGDDTPALQAVLDADVWRKVLMKEQQVHGNLPP